MKNNSKKSLEEKKERAIEFIIKRGMREAVGLERKNTERRNAFSIFIPPKWEEIYDYKN